MQYFAFFYLLMFATLPAGAQAPEKFEMRGVWVASVVNLDWPTSRTASSSAQQGELIRLLDALEAAGINAVFFQVRAESDALYASEIEPWSYWLTGQQGRAPQPFYDPLAFAVEEAHRRGMELHAWINPFRADRGSGYAKAASHVTNAHSEWILQTGGVKILDPGQPAVRDHVTRVILDIVRRYDVDGIHFDDYFYPYPPNAITNQDAATFAAHGGDFQDVGDWRRDNINRFVEQVHDSLEAVDPSLAFGISPFGIWKNGVPAGISGLDAYSVIYADATAWLDEQTIDYLVPQLYWPFGGGQDYASLADFWTARAEFGGRHVYPGLALYRINDWPQGEMGNQLRFNRAASGIDGEVLFRAQFVQNNTGGFADSLKTDFYRYPALTPPMAWKDQTFPPHPDNLTVAWTSEGAMLRWRQRASPAGRAPAQFFGVYRVQAADAPDPAEALRDPRNLYAVTGDTVFTDNPPPSPTPYHYFVTAFSANSIETLPSEVLTLEGRPVSTEAPTEVGGFALLPNHPNPFARSTEIRFVLQQPARISLRIFDVQGREVAVLADDQPLNRGAHALQWRPRSLPSGTYFATLEVGGRRGVQAMTLAR